MIPEKIGRYKVIKELGRGGMATVYQAHDPSFDREVAIKSLPVAFMHDPHFRIRFEREAKTIAALEHPAIVPVYDFGEEGGQPYIVMRLMPGGSLTQKIKQAAISVADTVKIFARLAPALDTAHAKGIIHRDLKPDNIHFDQYGNAYISDYGIARIIEATTTLTAGAAIGTPAYMSPEQVQGDREIDGRSDIYSMGIILYQMLTGEVPYQGTTPAKVMLKHILEPIPDLHDLPVELQPIYNKVLLKSLAKNPDERFATVQAMVDALMAAVELDTAKQPGLRPAEPETVLAEKKPSGPQAKPVASSGQASQPQPAASRPDQAGVIFPARPTPTPAPGSMPATTPPPAAQKRPRLGLMLVGFAALLLICSLIVVFSLMAMKGTFNRSSGASDIERTAIALGVQSTQDARIQATRQAIETDQQATIERGRAVAQSAGCLECHTTDGSPSVGPGWKNLFGSEVTLQNGQIVIVDSDFLRTSILNPNAQIVSGFTANQMPSDYVTRLSTGEINDLVRYIISLSGSP